MNVFRWPRMVKLTFPAVLVTLLALSGPAFLAGCGSGSKDQPTPNKPVSDEELIAAQGSCPVSGKSLGSMGKPVKVMIKGEPVLLC